MAAVSGKKGRRLADVTPTGTGVAVPVALLKDWSLDLSTDNGLGSHSVDVKFMVDHLNVVMMLVITGVGSRP